MNITGPVIEVIRQLLANGNPGDGIAGFNTLMTGDGFPEISIDFTPQTSLQFFEMSGDEEDVEEEDNPIYPMCFIAAMRSDNIHEQMGLDFAGLVSIGLRFTATSDAPKPTVAKQYLQRVGIAIESAVNDLMADGNWPQAYGVNGVCGRYPFTFGKAMVGGGSWVQAFTVQLTFNVFAQ